MKPLGGHHTAAFSGQGIAPDAAYKQRHDHMMAAARTAAQAWLAAQQQRPVSKKKAPWDENTWFQVPVYTNVLLQMGVDTIVAPSNPQRIGLIFQNIISGAGANAIYVKPNVPVLTASPDGFALITTTLPWSLLQKEWYQFVQSEWHGVCQGGQGNLSVLELVLREYPPGGF